LPAFEAALDVGVSTLELDLHLSSDGLPVIWHDSEIDPTKCVAGNMALPSAEDKPGVRTLTAAELATYQCDLNPDRSTYPDQRPDPGVIAGSRYTIVTLEALFEMTDDYAQSTEKTQQQRENATSVQFNIELKRDPDNPAGIGDSFDGEVPGEFETAVADLIAEWGYADRVIVQSFDHRSLWAIRTIAPTIRLAALTSSGVPDFGDLAESGASIWSPRHTLLSAALVAEAQSTGLQVIPWTVNDPDDLCSVLSMGTAGVITDRPDLVLGDGGWLSACGG
jgi:glycerophosphoryl diester phosphodiesterase